MNELTKKNNFISKIKKLITENIKFLFISIFIIISVIAFTQYFIYYNEKKILKTSLDFSKAKSNSDNSDFRMIMIELSKKKNFYGILATLEKINLIINDDIYLANDEYMKLLNDKKITNIYKSAIAIHGSYSFLNKIEFIDSKISTNNEKKIYIIEKVNNLLFYVDSNLISYEALKLEILFMISILEKDSSVNNNNNDDIVSQYNFIMNNENISSSIKERVNKINEFQKYK